MLTWLSNIKEKPLELIIGLCIFAIAVSGGAVKDVASTSLAVMFISSLFYVNEWKSMWGTLERTEKLILIGFVMYTLTALLSWVNADDNNEFIKQFGRYLRFTFAIPVYLMIRTKQLDLKRFFLAGVVISGFLYLGMALDSVIQDPGMPASGQYHHITFGDAAMLNVGLMGVMLLFCDFKPMPRFVISVALLCGIYAVFLSQARGAWIMLPLYLLVAMVYLIINKKSDAIKLVLISGLVAVIIIFSPVGMLVEKRIDEAATEITQFVDGERYDTSIGGRLSMWEIAIDVWKENPVVGSGLGDYDEDLMRFQAMGRYPSIDVHGSTHNIFVQALVGTGVIGFIALCFGLVIAPLLLFYRKMNEHKSYATMGLLVIASYIVFGLTESWILRAPAISIYLAYLITLANSLKSR